jgi:hypothetical protein
MLRKMIGRMQRFFYRGGGVPWRCPQCGGEAVEPEAWPAGVELHAIDGRMWVCKTGGCWLLLRRESLRASLTLVPMPDAELGQVSRCPVFGPVMRRLSRAARIDHLHVIVPRGSRFDVERSGK